MLALFLIIMCRFSVIKYKVEGLPLEKMLYERI